MERLLIALLIASAALLASCQKPGEPIVPMTQEQWRRVDRFLLDELPDSATPVGATFGEDVKLVGWEVEPESLKAGEEFTLTLYWQALREVERPWELFIHLDSPSGRQNIDRSAASGVLAVPHWPTDRIVRDTMTQTASSNLDGDVTVFAGLYIDEERLPVTDTGEAERVHEDRLALGTVAAEWDPPRYEAKWIDSQPRLDGRLVERIWSRTESTSRWVHPATNSIVESQHTWAKVLWDREFIYIGIRGRDTDIWSTLTERDSDLWDEEVFEVYLDPGGDGRDYLEIQVNPQNAVFDALFPRPTNRDHTVARQHNVAGMSTQVYVQGSLNERDDRDVYWSAEIRIPWASLPDFETPPKNGDEIHANFYRFDRNKDEPVHATAWSSIGGGTFHKPNRFGVIELTGGPEVEAPTPDGSSEGEQEGAQGSGDSPTE